MLHIQTRSSFLGLRTFFSTFVSLPIRPNLHSICIRASLDHGLAWTDSIDFTLFYLSSFVPVLIWFVCNRSVFLFLNFFRFYLFTQRTTLISCDSRLDVLTVKTIFLNKKLTLHLFCSLIFLSHFHTFQPILAKILGFQSTFSTFNW